MGYTVSKKYMWCDITLDCKYQLKNIGNYCDSGYSFSVSFNNKYIGEMFHDNGGLKFKNYCSTKNEIMFKLYASGGFKILKKKEINGDWYNDR